MSVTLDKAPIGPVRSAATLALVDQLENELGEYVSAIGYGWMRRNDLRGMQRVLWAQDVIARQNAQDQLYSDPLTCPIDAYRGYGIGLRFVEFPDQAPIWWALMDEIDLDELKSDFAVAAAIVAGALS